jgi:hypothetical protein
VASAMNLLYIVDASGVVVLCPSDPRFGYDEAPDKDLRIHAARAIVQRYLHQGGDSCRR